MQRLEVSGAVRPPYVSLGVKWLRSACKTDRYIHTTEHLLLLGGLYFDICVIFVMFELLAVPQRGIPYVQKGFRIHLYSSNLFSIDSSKKTLPKPVT